MAGEFRRIDSTVAIEVKIGEQRSLRQVLHLSPLGRAFRNPLTAGFIELRLRELPITIQIEFCESRRPTTALALLRKHGQRKQEQCE